jgi:hypothetical protein
MHARSPLQTHRNPPISRFIPARLQRLMQEVL